MTTVMLLRALALWVLFAAIAVACGTVREIWLTPRLGALRAHQLGTAAVCSIFFGICYAALPLLNVNSLGQAWAVGTLWVAMTIAFEFGFGHYVARHPWSKLLADYNLRQGRVWIFVLVVLWVGPAIAFTMRGT